MEDIRTITLIIGFLAIGAGLVSLFWRQNPSNEDAERRTGICLSVVGLAFLVLAGLTLISTTLSVVGVIVTIIIVGAAVWQLLIK